MSQNNLNNNVYNEILKNVHNQLFLNKDLTYDHLMYLINNRYTIEDRMFRFINDQLHHVILDDDLRHSCLNNFMKFSHDLIYVNSDNMINSGFVPIDDDVVFDDDDGDDDDEMDTNNIDEHN